MNPGALVLLDGSSCYYKDGQWLITASAINVIGNEKDDTRGLRRSCCVGLVKVLCNQVNLFANRYAIVTKLHKNTSVDPKFLETSIVRVESQTSEGEELPTEDPPNKRRKKSTGKPLSLKKLLSMIEVAAKKEVLANPAIATVDIVTANYDVAYVTLLMMVALLSINPEYRQLSPLWQCRTQIHLFMVLWNYLMKKSMLRTGGENRQEKMQEVQVRHQRPHHVR